MELCHLGDAPVRQAVGGEQDDTSPSCGPGRSPGGAALELGTYRGLSRPVSGD